MLERCQAALLIGDPALFASREHPTSSVRFTVLDLAEEWRAMMNLPFVSRFWAGPRREDSAALAGALADSLEEGLSKIPEIARERAGADPELEAAVRAYLSSRIHYGSTTRRSEGSRRSTGFSPTSVCWRDRPAARLPLFGAGHPRAGAGSGGRDGRRTIE